MCFGDKRDEDQIRKIEKCQRDFLLSFSKFNMLNVFPRIGKIIFRSRWSLLKSLRKNLEEALIPIIRSRLEFVKKQKEMQQQQEEEEDRVVAYVDTLANLELPDEKRKLTEEEMVTICSEFLNAGTDTTSTALQWIMANLVKYPQVQSKLYDEIVGIVGPKPKQGENEGAFMIRDEDLGKIAYLKAVVLEGLRRHPPGHFVLPHSVKEDVELDGYVIPKGANVNFMVADMGWDPKVWENPMEFKPERFLSNNNTSNENENCCNGDREGASLFDITGNREIKMMPFGAGRRICPGANLALLHLEFFVANLVWYFEWKAVEGDDVDLSEKLEFTVVMKNPLRVNLCPRG